MLSLLYVSSAVHLFSDDDLRDLLQQSRANNTRLDLTGMLLYKDGNFMQVLEGPDEALLALYAKILRDPRHHSVLQLMRREIQDREFSSWSMGFKNLKDANLQQTPGYSTFMNESLISEGFKNDPTRAQRLLATFREKM